MTDSKNSINFSDMFDYESPFGGDSIFNQNWDAKRAQVKLQVHQSGEIIEINIVKGDLIGGKQQMDILKDNLDPIKYRSPNYKTSSNQLSYRTLTYSIIIGVEGSAEAIYVSVSGKRVRAREFMKNYLAVFDLKIPSRETSSFSNDKASLAKEGKKEFEIFAEITDFMGTEIYDKKKLTVNIRSSGQILGGKIIEDMAKKECYCLSQGLVDVSCNFQGKSITDNSYSKLAEELSLEKAILMAIGKKESRNSAFVQDDPKKALILLERHNVYRLIKEKYGEVRADSLSLERPDLCHKQRSPNGQFGTDLGQITRLETVKMWDFEIAIKSCSWGKFQISGEYFSRTTNYRDAAHFEQAMNQCELQQFQYFKVYITKSKNGKLLIAIRNKNWEKIAEYYNGDNWKIVNPDYASKLKNYYEEFKSF